MPYDWTKEDTTEDMLAQYRERMGSVGDRLSDVLANRQAGLERAGRMEAERVAELEKAQKQAEFEQETNMASYIGKGAQIGSVGGGWGALAGAIAGTGVGIKAGWDARKKKGEGFWKRTGGIMNDLFNPAETLKEAKQVYQQDPQMVAQLAGTAAQAYRNRDKSSVVSGDGTTDRYQPNAGDLLANEQATASQFGYDPAQMQQSADQFRFSSETPDFQLEQPNFGQRPVRRRGFGV